MVCTGVPYGAGLWQVADSKEQNGSFNIAMSKIKSEILKKRLNISMDHPNIQPTDIIPCVNFAWEHLFARVGTNLKAIADRGCRPLNFNLLMNEDVKATMTISERNELRFMMKQQPVLYNLSPTSSIAIKTSTSNSTISDLTGDSMNCATNYDPKYLRNESSSVTTLASKMNFKTGRSAFVVRTLLHETALNEAREENQKLVLNGKETRKMLDGFKKLTAMLNFRNIGCKIGEDTLNVRLEMLKNKKDNENKVQQKKDNVLQERKRKYQQIISEIEEKNIPIDYLSTSQLNILCQYKKNPNDKVSISKLKRDELPLLWMQWMHQNEISSNNSDHQHIIFTKKQRSEELDAQTGFYGVGTSTDAST